MAVLFPVPLRLLFRFWFRVFVVVCITGGSSCVCLSFVERVGIRTVSGFARGCGIVWSGPGLVGVLAHGIMFSVCSSSCK